MLDRCYKIQHNRYLNYGGRGIRVCDEWLDKETGYMKFKEWSLANGYKEGLTIDRIDVHGNYCPENCRWADNVTQCNNKTNNLYIGIEFPSHSLDRPSLKYVYTASEWSKITGIKSGTIRHRLSVGWSVEDALTIVPNINNGGVIDYTNRQILCIGSYIGKNRPTLWDISIHD